MPTCTCPAATAIANVPNASCPQDFGQIQKLIFQRVYSSGATKNFFTVANSKLKANWTANFSASNGTKMVITPYVEAPTADGGDPVTFGGGNDTIGGVTKIVGRNPINMSFALRQYDQSIVKALKALQCEVALGVYFVNNDGAVLGISDGTNVYPIPIVEATYFVSDLKLNGLDTPDNNDMQFSLAPNWSDNATIIVGTDFNALTDFANATS